MSPLASLPLLLDISPPLEDLVDEELLEADFDFEELDFDMSGHRTLSFKPPRDTLTQFGCGHSLSVPPSDATLQATPLDVDDGVELKAEVSSGKSEQWLLSTPVPLR